MTVPLPAAAVERIDEVCDRFENDWKNGAQPRFEDYLDGTIGAEREALLIELLRVDAHYRGRAKAAPTLMQGNVPAHQQPIIAGYEILGELGRGGMGVVYQARQLRPNRLVALKMISAGAHAGPRELERFRAEADAVAQLQHPDIVQVYEVGEQDGCPYFTLEYVAGGSLDRHLAGTPQPPRVAAQLVERLAHAIHHAHARGIIHRDLKPANVLLQISDCRLQIERPQSDDVAPFQSAICNLQSAIPKITDFGLAKLLGGQSGGPTLSGDLLGTPSYMAPEQVGGNTAPINATTDVYGLGAILYEMLTGRPPFKGETALETMLLVQTIEPVSPSRMQPNCPRDLVTICLKCLSKEPGQRYSSASALAEDLRHFLDGQPIKARPVGSLRQALKWTRRQPVVASLAGLLLLAVTLGAATGSWFWWQAEVNLEKTKDALSKERTAQAERLATLDRYQVALAHREWLANNVGRADALLDACTPDQRETWEWRFLDRLRRSPLHTFAGHTNTVQAIAVHPLGRQVASASHDKSVRVWDLDTGHGKVLGHHRILALTVAYSPDGKLLASSGSRDGLIKLWDATSGAELPGLMFGEKEDKAATVWTLAFDPDSRYLAAGGPQRVKVWDVQDRTLVYDQEAHSAAISKVAFSPDGKLLATAMIDIKVWDWTEKAAEPRHTWPGHTAGTHDLAFNKEGNQLASGGRDGLIRVHSLLTNKQEFTLNAHQLFVTSVGFSPDGTRLASAGREGDMHVWNLKERRRLFTLHGHSGAVWDLAYTPPDGSSLVSAGQDFLVRVWDAKAGQEARTLPFRAAEEVSAVAYSPDGRLLAWGDVFGRVAVGDVARGQVVHRLGAAKHKARDPIVSFVFSRDGRLLVCRQNSGRATLWDLEREAEVPLLGNQHPVHGLTFTPDGRLLAATREKVKLLVHDLRTGQELLKLARPGVQIAQVVWSPDASCFVTNEDGFARLWASDTGRPLGEIEHQPSVTCLTFSADGRFLGVGGVYGGLRVWDRTENRQCMEVPGHSSRVFGLAFSADGRRLASTGSDCVLKLWETQTGHEVLTLRTQLHEHSPLAFSPDGADLLSVNMNHELQISSTRGVRRGP